MNMILSKITNLLAAKKPKRYSVKKNRKTAISCLEKALQYALKAEVSIPI
jgi:LPS O-antigen subunit length determinant protein (WzzB/FepE family)